MGSRYLRTRRSHLKRSLGSDSLLLIKNGKHLRQLAFGLESRGRTSGCLFPLTGVSKQHHCTEQLQRLGLVSWQSC